MSAQAAVCRLCANGQAEQIQASQPPYAVYRCKSCDFGFVFPQPRFEDLVGAYNQDDYYAEWVGAQAAPRKRMWRRRAVRVLAGLRPGELLDVGCGEGSFLDAAKQLGWIVRGTEVSASGCRMAKDQWGIDVFNGVLEDAKLPSDRFDIVSLWHVIEHVPDPLATIKEVVRVTRPGGRIIVACPNRHARLFNIAYRIGRGRPMHLFHPSDRELHLSHFTVRSLRRLLESCGLQVKRIDVDRGHVQPVKYLLDLVATGWHRISGGIVWSEAMEMWAEKPQ